MTDQPVARRGRLARLAAIAVVLVVLAGAGLWWFSRPSGTRVTAYFNAAVGLYQGSDVRVLGMPVGRITQVTPAGRQVRVDMVVDPGISVPANAQAVAVAPSLVSDRYVQFSPPYRGGPRMPDGTVLRGDRATTPLELDDINRNLDKMMTALGPNGANRQGALADALNVQAANLRGNGALINQMLTQLSHAQSTLSGSQEDWFATIDHLQRFNHALADSDQQVQHFDEQLAEASHFLADQRGQLGGALHDLGPALEDVRTFVANNRGGIKSNVDNLAGVTKVLADQKAALAEVLDVTPVGLTNLANTYDASTQSLLTRGNLNELSNPPILIVCKLLKEATPTKPVPPVLADTCRRLEPMLDGAVPLPSPAQIMSSLQQGKPPPLPLPLVRGGWQDTTPGRGGDR